MFSKDLSLHHLVANLVKNVDERGRNIVRTHITEQNFFICVLSASLFVAL